MGKIRLDNANNASGQRKNPSKLKKAAIIAACIIIVLFALSIGFYFYLHPQGHYTAEDFGITRIHSSVDFNHNGIDDYEDILLGARQDAENHVIYNSAYVYGGYPPDGEGVCADEIWRAFKNAGYDLKAMIDKDIAANTGAYPRVDGKPDPNIDFRRVPNLKVFFQRYALSLTLDISKIDQWQPGDIVTLGKSHIGVISDIRDKNGVPYLIHNNNQRGNREEDVLSLYAVTDRINGHYRFDASRVDQSVIAAWRDN